MVFLVNVSQANPVSHLSNSVCIRLERAKIKMDKKRRKKHPKKEEDRNSNDTINNFSHFICFPNKVDVPSIE